MELQTLIWAYLDFAPTSFSRRSDLGLGAGPDPGLGNAGPDPPAAASTARPDSRPRPAPRRHSPDPQGLGGPGHAPAARIQRWWRRHPPPGAYLPPGTYRMADLFAGVLGFSHGVELCNADQDRRVRTVLSFEGCPAACRTSRANRHGRHHRVCRRTLSEDSVGPISAALRRAGVDLLVGSPPCQDHFNGRGLNAKGPPRPPSARATAGILMAKIAIAGGVPAVAFENAPGYVRSPAWAAMGCGCACGCGCGCGCGFSDL